MLIRYKQDENGKTVPVANIYTQNEHRINPAMLDRDAVWAIRKLQQSGAEAYIVGGAVRDLMLGNVPKDFDIATSASPRQIQRLFWNARIIGKRFKLVHLVFKEKILEVSTFRSGEEAMDGNNNVFGSIDQDAKRRDFSINSFYFDPSTAQLLDFNNAMEDFKKKKISSIIPLDDSFKEDPVRMIRAIKYSVSTGFSLRFNVRMAIRKYANELSRTSTSRLTEEVNKILGSGHSREIFNDLQKYKLLVFMLPCFSVYSKFPQVQQSLKDLDEKVTQAKNGKGEEVNLADMIKALVSPLIFFTNDQMTSEERFKETFRQIKVLISPMTPSNYEVELASEHLLIDRGYRTPRNCVRGQRPTNKPPQRRTPSRQRKTEENTEVSTANKKRRPHKRRNPSAMKQEVAPASTVPASSSAEAHDL
ncbi:tRNA nucleotidyltransferase/poly(A) polymerase [Sphaerochaeta pleomorpha str. Grapes]|uniref:tRNA nucleotidyltransferase/poly(A) polymerase n=1 Tax=Sphaerochaeta pleomorpha (strain ATCC BAA-1885 / DSM 22778 / Grapes) TaxID=158190 RepID=G8QWN4_SPHPG|nr:CCA tRNA nucleotidyltransferase [Sphaerochaeta pleomorpha]AEV28328.1 tRNA nucleotidyltransferase/poly(A) polymerase [Sphaerochaeta pleomorpha str. Grapes]